jgi:2',3'-cyclic-nucleotide 2'-phosphodiesterase
MRVLCIGDVVAGAGRRAVRALLPGLVAEHAIDLVVANAENAAGGIGLTPIAARDLLDAGVHVLTGGNHTFRYAEALPLIEGEPRVLRPLNYPEGTPGRGAGVFETRAGEKVGIVNLLGRLFLEPVPCPFRAARAAAEELARETPVILVDFHAEATSEKRALGFFLDGKVSAVFGTHTHVPTADEEILPEGTGYITDLGMTGPYRSVIGMRIDTTLRRFLTLRHESYKKARDDVRLAGALFDIDPGTGRARSVLRIRADQKA